MRRMSPPRVHLVRASKTPVERVFTFLSEHENLGKLFGARIRRVSDGADGTRNGVGSARELAIGPLPKFVETTTVCVPQQRIEYAITSGVTPLKDHRGVMVFTALPNGGTRLEYDIAFDAKLPGIAALVGRALARSIGAGLEKIDQLA